MIRLLYALYAFTILFFTWRFHGDTLAVEVLRKGTIALWIGGLAAVFTDWKYARYIALAAFVPVFVFLIYETSLRYSMPGSVLVPTQAAFEVALFAAGAMLCVWLWRTKKI